MGYNSKITSTHTDKPPMIRPEILSAINTLQQGISQAIPDDESGNALRTLFQDTIRALESDAEYGFVAEDLLTTLITHYPNLTPAIPRELLWAIGGSCLHYLGDEEIEQFSEIEEQQSTRH